MLTYLSNKSLSVTIQSKGAEIVAITDLATQQNYIWNGNPVFWGKHAPILFPIVGSLKNDSYEYKGEAYFLNRHGFARDMEFEIHSQSESEEVFVLQSDNQTKKNYPFDFLFFVKYVLDGNCIHTFFEIHNTGDEIMPYSIGGHPAFSLPNTFEDYHLEFEINEDLNCFPLNEGLISENSYSLKTENGKFPLTYPTFEHDAIVIKKLESKKITIVHLKKPLIAVHFKDFQNLGIWTKVGAPFICIEPWLGYSDTVSQFGALEKKEGIQLLNPSQKNICMFTIEIL